MSDSLTFGMDGLDIDLGKKKEIRRFGTILSKNTLQIQEKIIFIQIVQIPLMTKIPFLKTMPLTLKTL
ncbi:hypothetical protein PCANC_17342 [Puccinia coronata f. sp. avenae]|uniref:Uncharacterized protein n=1 Tax=Puccinia coronata f. sp. avenae TaxID=200324 RepID=A0A2N5UU86_9BASI|nr:hypothetical protein PCANC_16249 [Puccinia coronata f. sp. avenae]PLW41325.1 hypothetical protein PCANC_17342 [Puccinia coronata f. sp. avenae]